MEAIEIRHTNIAGRHLTVGPRKRPMLRALRDTVLTDPVTGERIQFLAGMSLVAPDHDVFQRRPEARQHFELIDAVKEMKRMSDAVQRENEPHMTGREYWRLPIR